MPRCDFCKHKCGLMIFRCACCKKSFCVTHRIPESHDCENYNALKEKNKVCLESIEAKKRTSIKF